MSERMLYCYNVHPSLGGRLVRAMPLEGAIISAILPSNAKYPYMFEVHNLNYLFRMRAANEEDRKRWIQVLKEERESHTLFPHQVGVDTDLSGDEGLSSEGHSQKQFMQDLTATQKARYHFFKNQRDYLRNLTQVAEDLRFQERDDRKALAPQFVDALDTPSCVYIPLCNSTDVWRRVSTAVAKETRVFNTNERCPVVMYFLTRRGEKMSNNTLDVAAYLKSQYEVPDASLIPTIAEEESLNFEVIDSESGIMVTPSREEFERSSSSHKLWSDEENSQEPVIVENFDGNEVGTEKYLGAPESGGKGGNAQLKNFLKENFVRIPSKIKARLPNRGAKKPLMAQGMLPMQRVPILENRTGEDNDEKSILSEVGGSMYSADGGMVVPKDRDGIDEESCNRAYDFICRGEPWVAKSERILREGLAEGVIDNNANTEVSSLIVKSNDDLRQEVFVMQMIHYYKSVFANASLPIWLRTYRILSTSKDTGIIEYLADTTSLDGLKKTDGYPVEGGLRAYFEQIYGPPEGKSFKAAQRNFMLSLVGYSLVSYLLGLKDRHNGNIMIDTRGRLIFIDFGFAMGLAPGHEFYIERAPFKFTLEYLEVMGGPNSSCFAEFKRLFVAGFQAARTNSQIALGLVEIMMYKSNYPCFSGPRYGGNQALIAFQNRLMLNVPDKEVPRRALSLIESSIDNRGTWLYDRFQLYSNGYAM